MRIVIFGAVGPYTGAISRELAAHHELVACVTHGRVRRWLFSISEREVTGIACPVWEVTPAGYDALWRKLRKQSVDAIVVAGFPRLLPSHILRGCTTGPVVNAHPALLPQDRGPSPLFWALRRGDTETGVTVHELTDEFDSGDILLQLRWPMPFGGRANEWFSDAGSRVGKALSEALPGWISTPPAKRVQGASPNGWARKPNHQDLELVAGDWTASRLFHFAKGARFFGVPWARLADDVYYFDDALECVVGQRMPGEFMVIRDELTLQLTDGTVRFLLRQ